MVRLLLGTYNTGKQAELRVLLDHPNWELVTPQELGLEIEVDEIGTTYAENAQRKAVSFASQTGLWSLSDDSGLEVDVLHGAPGLRSARLAGKGKSDFDRRRALLELLKSHPRPWKARFRATVALANPTGKVDLAEGYCTGEIIPEERGKGGFGYDPIFLIHGADMTMAELEMEDKNRISHRARAVMGIIPILMERLSDRRAR